MGEGAYGIISLYPKKDTSDFIVETAQHEN